MVLTAGKGGAGTAGAPRNLQPGRSDTARDVTHDRGSQTLEFALLLPIAALLAVLGLHAGLLAADLVAVQGLAREAARAAAVTDDDAARAAVERAAGRQAVRVALEPASPREPGTLVAAEVTLESRAFRAFGQRVWLPGHAVMRVEDAR